MIFKTTTILLLFISFVGYNQQNYDLYIEIVAFDKNIKVFESENDSLLLKGYQIRLKTCDHYDNSFYFDSNGKLVRTMLAAKKVPTMRLIHHANKNRHNFKLVNELKLNKLYYPTDFYLNNFDSLQKVFKEARKIYMINEKKINGKVHRFALNVKYSLLRQL